jgi:hypothetical protein
VLKQLDFIQLTLPETRLHSFSTVRFVSSPMRVLVAIVALLSSCSSLPPRQENRETPTPSPRSLELKIPNEIWEPLFFKDINDRAKLSNLKSLRSAALPGDDFEVRVWRGFGLTGFEGFVLRRASGVWSASLLKNVAAKGASNQSLKMLRAPKSGWGASLQRLENAGLFTLPDAIAIRCLASLNDGWGYVVEFNRDGVYRTYMYENPDHAPCKEAKRMIQIGNIISEEFGLPQLGTK